MSINREGFHFKSCFIMQRVFTRASGWSENGLSPYLP
jgi:hypothetical protein